MPLERAAGAARRVRCDDDPVTPNRRGLQRLRLLGERMIGRATELERHRADRPMRDLQSAGAARNLSDCDVGALLEQRLPGAAEHFRRQLDSRRVAGRSRSRRRRPATTERDQLVAGDRELGFPAAAERAHPPLDSGRRVEQRAAFIEQQPARVREHGAVTAAVEYLQAEIVLELAYGVRQGRSRTMELAARRCEAAAAGNGIEHLQGIERQAHERHRGGSFEDLVRVARNYPISSAGGSSHDACASSLATYRRSPP